MKNLLVWLLVILTFSLQSCELIGGIFKVGMWVGIIIVVGIVLLILWLVGRFRK